MWIFWTEMSHNYLYKDSKIFFSTNLLSCKIEKKLNKKKAQKINNFKNIK